MVTSPSTDPRPPLPRPDERLRRSGQHHHVSSPLRLARHRARRATGRVSATVSLLDSCDLIFFGGGQDREQAVISPDFVSEKGEAVREAVEDGAVVLAVCGGYQLLGHTYTTVDGQELPGAGVFDVRSVPGTRRHIGNLVAEADAGRHAADAGRVREPQRPDLSRAGLHAARQGAPGRRQQRRGRHRGRRLQGRLRLLPARLAAAEEPVAGRPSDRAGAASPLRRAMCPWPRWTTRWRSAPTRPWWPSPPARHRPQRGLVGRRDVPSGPQAGGATRWS